MVSGGKSLFQKVTYCMILLLYHSKNDKIIVMKEISVFQGLRMGGVVGTWGNNGCDCEDIV